MRDHSFVDAQSQAKMPIHRRRVQDAENSCDAFATNHNQRNAARNERNALVDGTYFFEPKLFAARTFRRGRREHNFNNFEFVQRFCVRDWRSDFDNRRATFGCGEEFRGEKIRQKAYRAFRVRLRCDWIRDGLPAKRVSRDLQNRIASALARREFHFDFFVHDADFGGGAWLLFYASMRRQNCNHVFVRQHFRLDVLREHSVLPHALY